MSGLWKFAVLVISFQVHGFRPLKQDNGLREGTSSSLRLMPDEKTPQQPPKQRVITPGDIESLFGKYTPRQPVQDEEEYDFDEDVEEQLQPVELSTKPKSIQGENARVLAELEKLEAMSLSSAQPVLNQLSSVPPAAKKAPADPVAPGLEYLDLSAALDTDQQTSLQQAMTLIDKDASDTAALSAPRVFQYDPTESAAYRDPMQFGAYNRWKRAEEAVAKSNLKKNPKKTKEGLSPNSFYNSIKNLGSGPKAKDASTGVGVAEPPRGTPPVTPKKGLSKKNKKKVITPEEIDSLFGAKEAEVAAAAESPLLRDDEEVPQWIVDAEKAAKKQRAMRGRKQRKVTDDWRFWAAIIGTIGFATAFYTVTQQTGGFDAGAVAAGTELII